MRAPELEPDNSDRIERQIAAARAGSQGALGQALESCRAYLFLVANTELSADLRALGGPSDLVQETCLEAQRDFAAFRGRSEAELLGWLRRILLNNLTDFVRRHHVAQRRADRNGIRLDVNHSSGGAVLELPADLETPSGEAAAREETDALERALSQLPAPYREVLRLRNWERRSFQDIGYCMNRSADAARMLWYRAIQRLRQALNGTS